MPDSKPYADLLPDPSGEEEWATCPDGNGLCWILFHKVHFDKKGKPCEPHWYTNCYPGNMEQAFRAMLEKEVTSRLKWNFMHQSVIEARDAVTKEALRIRAVFGGRRGIPEGLFKGRRSPADETSR